MEAIQDFHARVRRRGGQLGTRTLSEEHGNEQTHFNHDEVDGDASPGTRGERLELILDHGLALLRREPASVIESVHIHVSRTETLRPGKQTHVSGSSHAAGLRCRAPVCVVTAVAGGMM